ncbi:Protein of unknown function [Bacillus mycoides]
MRKIL